MEALPTSGPTSLVVRLDNLGDVLLAGPAVRAVAVRSKVTMLCGPNGAAGARLLPGVDRVIHYRAPWIDAAIPFDATSAHQLLRLVEAGRFADAIVLTSSHQSPLPVATMLRMAGVPRIVGLTVDTPGSLLDECLRGDPDLHEVERALAIASLAGYGLPDGDDGSLRLRPLPEPPDDLPHEFVVVHPGASAPARTLRPARWAAVVEALDAAGHCVVVTGSASERLPEVPAIDLCGRTNLATLAAVLARASVVCVGNTGPAHLAAAVRTPVCAVFAPTVPVERWRPWGVPHVILGDQTVPCAGCRARQCPLDTQHCLAPVGPDEVVAAVGRLAGVTMRAVTAGSVR